MFKNYFDSINLSALWINQQYKKRTGLLIKENETSFNISKLMNTAIVLSFDIQTFNVLL